MHSRRSGRCREAVSVGHGCRAGRGDRPLFGGACHNDPKPGQAYGDMVMDLYDVVLFHLPTLTWLPQKGLPSNYQQRGGTNTLIRSDDGRCFVFGGMNSDEGDDEPTFLSDMTELTGLNAGAKRERPLQLGAAAGAAMSQSIAHTASPSLVLTSRSDGSSTLARSDGARVRTSSMAIRP